jgi:hypothetical protein
MARVDAPWTVEQTVALNAWQRAGRVHPFTCGGDRMDNAHIRYAAAHGGDNGQLIATPNGWSCPVCSYRQTWAHDFMFRPPPGPLPGLTP